MGRSWLGRPTGRHAAGRRGRGADAGSAKSAPTGVTPPSPTPPGTAGTDTALTGQGQADAPLGNPVVGNPAPDEPVLDDPVLGTDDRGSTVLGAPTMADAPGPSVSPVTEEARAAAAGTSPATFVPPWAVPQVTIDALGRKCPIPIIMLAEQIRDVPVGSVIAVLADDPAAYTDIPAWCGLKSHDCVFRVNHASGWSFGINRRY